MCLQRMLDTSDEIIRSKHKQHLPIHALKHVCYMGQEFGNFFLEFFLLENRIQSVNFSFVTLSLSDGGLRSGYLQVVELLGFDSGGNTLPSASTDHASKKWPQLPHAHIFAVDLHPLLVSIHNT